MRWFVLLAAACVLAFSACAHPKASIDYTLSEGIIWPGPPAKARVKYLWSLWRVKGAEKRGRMLSLLVGGEEYETDPRESSLLVNPHGVFVDERGVLYVTDTGALRVSVVDLNTMDSFDIQKMGEAYFSAPIGVAAGADGRIYITDADVAAVGIYNEKGKFQKTFEGGFKRPTGIGLDNAAGRIYVADTWAHLVHVHDLDGRRLGSIGQRGEGPGRLNYPTHVAVGGDGLLYVSDTLNFRVQVFTPEGGLVSSFGVAGDAYHSFDKIKGIAVDRGGHVYVADSAQDMVKIFDRQGRLLLFFGQKGRIPGEFYLPAGLYIDGEDRIFVSDSLNGRVQVFQFLGGD